MKTGDFIEIEFVGTISITKEVFDLTSAEVAKEKGIFNPQQNYGPVLVILGDRMVMKVGEEKEFIVKPDEGFGMRNFKLIKIISLSKFKHEKVSPHPGMFVTIDNINGRVQSVSGGRVRVDFNHPLAGKDLEYKLKIIKHLTEPLEKCKSLTNYFGMKCEMKLETGTITIETEKEIPKEFRDVLNEKMRKYIKEIKKVDFREKK